MLRLFLPHSTKVSLQDDARLGPLMSCLLVLLPDEHSLKLS